MFERKTGDVVVRVEPDFLADQSSPADSRYIWAYTVEIENQSELDLQVVERFWKIADSQGQVQEIRGEGVVGEKPILRPGEIFRYTSGAPLSAPAGMMLGTYSLKTPNDPDAEVFAVEIPPFALDSPHTSGLIN